MDRRREMRIAVEVETVVTTLDGSSPPCPAKTVNVSGTGLRLRLPSPLRAGAAVELRLNNALMLGSVIYCEPAGEGFIAGLEIAHSLVDIADLERRKKEFLASR